MSEAEFLVLDQLYFVCSFEDLLKKTGLKSMVLIDTLKELIKKEWVRCLDETKEQTVETNKISSFGYEALNYLATKNGLFAHHTL